MCITPFGIDYDNNGTVSWGEDYLTYNEIRSGSDSDDSGDYGGDYSSYGGFGDSGDSDF